MWAQAVTAMSSVEDEAARVVQRAQTVAGWSQDEVRRQVSELAERLAAQRRELDWTSGSVARCSASGCPSGKRFRR